MLILTRRPLEAVKIGDEVGALLPLLGGRQIARWDQAATKQPLLIVAIEVDDPHGDILQLADEELDFGLGGPFRGSQVLPQGTLTADLFQGLLQAGEEHALQSIEFIERRRLVQSERLGFAFRQGKQLAAYRLVSAQIGQKWRIHLLPGDGEDEFAEGGGGPR